MFLHSRRGKSYCLNSSLLTRHLCRFIHPIVQYLCTVLQTWSSSMTQSCYHAYTKKNNISDQSKTVGMYYRILKPDQHIPIQSEASQVEGLLCRYMCVCVRGTFRIPPCRVMLCTLTMQKFIGRVSPVFCYYRNCKPYIYYCFSIHNTQDTKTLIHIHIPQ